jgi:hypothetical protein
MFRALYFHFYWRNCIIVGHSAVINCYALSATAFKHFKLCWQCNKNDIATIKTISCNKMQHEVAVCSSMLQQDMLPPDRACCSLIRTCCNWDRIFSSLFKTLYDMSIDICYRNTFHINRLKYVTPLKIAGITETLKM